MTTARQEPKLLSASCGFIVPDLDHLIVAFDFFGVPIEYDWTNAEFTDKHFYETKSECNGN